MIVLYSVSLLSPLISMHHALYIFMTYINQYTEIKYYILTDKHLWHLVNVISVPSNEIMEAIQNELCLFSVKVQPIGISKWLT